MHKTFKGLTTACQHKQREIKAAGTVTASTVKMLSSVSSSVRFV